MLRTAIILIRKAEFGIEGARRTGIGTERRGFSPVGEVSRSDREGVRAASAPYGSFVAT